MSLLYYVVLQVYCNLQPLNICLSHKGSINIVQKISQGYDQSVLEWQEDLSEKISKPQADVSINVNFVIASHRHVMITCISYYMCVWINSITT